MNCVEIDRHFGDAIDGVLPVHIKKTFHDHLNACRGCRTSFEFELFGKRMVRGKLRRVPTPHSVRTQITNSLRKQIEEVGLLQRLFSMNPSWPALAGGIAIILIAMVMTSPEWFSRGSGAHPPSNDIIAQSLQNFALIQSGELKPSLISCSPEGVLGYFDQNGVRFVVNVMPMENCEWYGAMLSEYEGGKLAHVVYKVDDHLMYVFQAKKEDVLNGTALDLPATARTALAQTGWWVDPEGRDQSLVMWTMNGTLCAAVSSMKKEHLLALLTTR